MRNITFPPKPTTPTTPNVIMSDPPMGGRGTPPDGQADPYWYTKLAIIGVGALAVAGLVLVLATQSDDPRRPALTNTKALPQFVLPDTCTVTEYDRLGRATHIACALNANQQDLFLANQQEVDDANEAGFEDGYTMAAETVMRAVDIECQQRALEAGKVQSRYAVTASDMCANIKRSMTAQFLK